MKRKYSWTFSEKLRRREARRRRFRRAALACVTVAVFCSGFSYMNCSKPVDALTFDSVLPSPALPEPASEPQERVAINGINSFKITPRARLADTLDVKEEPAPQKTLNSDSERVTSSGLKTEFSAWGSPVLKDCNEIAASSDSSSISRDQSGNTIHFTLDEGLQEEAKDLLKDYKVPWGAIVALEPQTGRVLTFAGHSQVSPSESASVLVRGEFPAASLFKIITASAAVEHSGLGSNSQIHFRGGSYTLNRYNYKPDARRDRRTISLETALGKSCNPAFGRIALNHLSSSVLGEYAVNFGFNSKIPFDVSLNPSRFVAPQNDYELARTAAGFGEVMITPLHAALIAATVANRGLMMKPYYVESIEDTNGRRTYQARPTVLRRVLLENTATQVLEMMEATVREGTARKYFRRSHNILLKNMRVAAKTGTLSGKNPRGRYHWFIAAAPLENPRVAIASLVIDPGNARINGTGIGRRFLEKFFSNDTIARLDSHKRENQEG